MSQSQSEPLDMSRVEGIARKATKDIFAGSGEIKMTGVREIVLRACLDAIKIREEDRLTTCSECKGLGDIQTDAGTHTCGFCHGTGVRDEVDDLKDAMKFLEAARKEWADKCIALQGKLDVAMGLPK